MILAHHCAIDCPPHATNCIEWTFTLRRRTQTAPDTTEPPGVARGSRASGWISAAVTVHPKRVSHVVHNAKPVLTCTAACGSCSPQTSWPVCCRIQHQIGSDVNRHSLRVPANHRELDTRGCRAATAQLNSPVWGAHDRSQPETAASPAWDCLRGRIACSCGKNRARIPPNNPGRMDPSTMPQARQHKPHVLSQVLGPKRPRFITRL